MNAYTQLMERLLNLGSIEESILLLGPRQTGKTYLIRQTVPATLYIDLLKASELARYSKSPDVLIAECEALSEASHTVVIDEVQLLPTLLNTVHHIIEHHPHIRFILTGSSARKLRREGTNLLAGRALTFHLHPLTYKEIGSDFSLPMALQYGTLPRVFTAKDHLARKRFLRSYAETYLMEEIRREALTRNVPAFTHFLELASFENGQILNYHKMSKKIGVASNTIKEYFQILEDTLLGFFLFPYKKSHRARLISHPKFYFFDPGVVRAIRKQVDAELIEQTDPFGQAFEHWMMLETQRMLQYNEREFSLSFFRTSDGAEVDLIAEVEDETWAIEFKSSEQPSSASLRGLKSFLKDHTVDRAICVCTTPRAYKQDSVEFVPWAQFLEML